LGYIESMPKTANAASSIPARAEVYSIQFYVIKSVSNLWQVNGFFLVIPFSSINKTDIHNRIEIVWKVALNTNNSPFPFRSII
jgi:hypothetical protein